MKILIAEDDGAFRRLLEDVLRRWDYEVVVTCDGNEAWQALHAEDAPQLAILDWMMPGMEGIEVCRKVRAEKQTPYVYIILLTSQQREEDLVIGMEAGADDYISKPFKTGELRVRLTAGRRIVELQNQLLEARETLAAHAAELEIANRDLETFSYTISDELLRSLLTIGSHARSIQELGSCRPDEECRSYTRRIYEKTKHLGELIGIMHDFFRPSRSEFRRETLDLSELAGLAAEKLRVSQPGRRVTFRIAEGVLAAGDRNLLPVVLEHLFENAWKHTAEQDAVIEFGVATVDGRPAYYVRDNGSGFDMAQADKLFLPFHRMPGSEKFAGQGIGLATVERSIRRHGGKVWAESAPGRGATFYFTLNEAPAPS